MKDYNLYVGTKKGRLTVVGYQSLQNGNSPTVKCTFLKCKCDCGNDFNIRPNSFDKRERISCGCWKSEIFKEIVTKDGRTKHVEYHVWFDMKARCYNKKHAEHKRYGERGIGVCDEWKDDFWQFLKDMGPRPSSEFSIERINNDLGYSPKNCKWATMKEQAQNRRPQERWRKQTENTTI